MSVKRDYYEVLGLSKGADAGSIKKAYRSDGGVYGTERPGEEKDVRSVWPCGI